MADIIATEQQAYEIGGKGTPVTNKMCTKSRAVELGCNVDGTYADNQLVAFKSLSPSYSYLCFTARQDGSTVGYTINGTVNKDIYYSTDGINWTSWDGTAITLNNGESIYVWNKVGSLSTTSLNYLKFIMSGSIAASGDISSMINWAALANRCYNSMFYGCTSLTTAPSLPATTLANNCYNSMFQGCTSLTTAPSLPATTLANYCYYGMFYDCTSLNHIKLSYTGTFNTDYFYRWVNNVAPTGTFYYNGSDTTRGSSAIPNGWTVQRF